MKTFKDILDDNSLSYPQKATQCVKETSEWSTNVTKRDQLKLGAIVFAILAVGEQINLASQDAL